MHTYQRWLLIDFVNKHGKNGPRHGAKDEYHCDIFGIQIVIIIAVYDIESEYMTDKCSSLDWDPKANRRYEHEPVANFDAQMGIVLPDLLLILFVTLFVLFILLIHVIFNIWLAFIVLALLFVKVVKMLAGLIRFALFLLKRRLHILELEPDFSASVVSLLQLQVPRLKV